MSKVPRPACFEDTEMICPPDHYHEASRYKAVKKFMSCDQWKETHEFNKIVSKALKKFRVKGLSISLIDSKRQVIKYQVSLNTTEIPRKLSIDAHTILSNGSFVLLDASKDWRTHQNPLIRGPPHIKFYAGVPLMTKFGSVIGAFAIFDEVLKTSFDKVEIEDLKEFAEEVIQILCRPLKGVSALSVSNTQNLISIIGRPTSHGNQLLPVAVYEKDGSGSQYSLNHSYRYNTHNFNSLSSDILVNEDVVRLVSKFRDAKSASSQLCQVIAKQLSLSFVCVTEVRVSQKYQILSDYLPASNLIDAESFKYANKLYGTEKEQVISRFLGYDGYRVDPEFTFDPEIFFNSLSSEFGVYFEGSGRHNIKFRAGICMPFYRIASRIVRKKKILKDEKASLKGKSVDVYLRSGGYLICAFSEEDRVISLEEINFIYGAACTLRRLFIAG